MSYNCSLSNREDKISVSVVPWYNAAEFKKVFEHLYSEDINKKRWACDTISVWETRCSPTLPAAIEASYMLTNAVIQDILWTNEASMCQYTDIQAVYGSAITRFVSLIVEVNQDYPNSRPAAHVAKGIGIPSHIVELRNEFCHSHRPSLSLLRKATQDALTYLRENYWQVEAERVLNHVKKLATDECSKIESLLRDYIGLKLDVLSQEKYGAGEYYNDESKLSRILSSIGYFIRKNKRLFVKTLISDGFFVPDTEDFKHMVSEKLFQDFLSELNEDAIPDGDFFTAGSPATTHLLPEIPTIHERLWEPVILELNRFHAVPTFMEALLRSQGDRTVFGQKLVIVWVMKLWNVNFYPRSVQGCFLKRIFHNRAVVVNWRRLFHAALVNPCKHTPVLLPQLLTRLDWNNDLKFHMVNMLAIYLGQVQEGFIKPPVNPRFFSVEELKLAKKQQKLENLKASGMSPKNIVPRYTDVAHKSWPVGLILNAAVNEEAEEVDDDDSENSDDEEGNERHLPCNENDNEEDNEKIDRPDVTFPNFSEIRKAFQKRTSLFRSKH